LSRALTSSHALDLHELHFLLTRRTQLEEIGSPAHPPVSAELPEPDAAATAFLKEWQLRK